MAHILIATGIFPPQIGGPAQYAKEIRDAFREQGHQVDVITYELERRLPPLARHFLFFFRTLMRLSKVDFVLALDTFSVGWPAVMAATLCGKKILIRTGGDFLWESYVERTGEKVLLRNFYTTCIKRFNFKERFIFSVTRSTLQQATAVIFSTTWQRDMFLPVYALDPKKCFIVENFYGKKLPLRASGENMSATSSGPKVFVAGTRPLVWKNIDRLTEAFAAARAKNASIALDTTPAAYEVFLEKIRWAYAVILVSLGDISPNMILDAIRAGAPFILTRENGLMNRIADIGVFCDPENPQDIAEKILWLADDANYAAQKKKVEAFLFTHSWNEIAQEIKVIADSASHYERH